MVAYVIDHELDEELVKRAIEGLDAPPPLAPTTIPIQGQILHQALGGSYYSLCGLIDAVATTYQFMANNLVNNSNVTWGELYVTPANQTISLDPTYRYNPVYKIDRVGMFDSGHNLVLWAVTHSLTGVPGQPRPIFIEGAIITGIFNATPEWIAERGGAGATIVPIDPTPIQEPVDYTRIQSIVEAALGATAQNSLVKMITTRSDGSISVRTAFRVMMEQASVYLSDPANYNDPHDPDHLAKKYQDNLFQFVKNASANPLANVLGGQDAWGQARRGELIEIVREGSH